MQGSFDSQTFTKLVLRDALKLAVMLPKLKKTIIISIIGRDLFPGPLPYF